MVGSLLCGVPQPRDKMSAKSSDVPQCVEALGQC